MSLITLFINLIRVLIVSLYYLIAPWVFCSSCLDFYTEVITCFSKLSNGKFYSIVNKDFIWGATDCYLYAKYCFNPLTASPTKWSHTLKQFVGCCREIICMFDHFIGLALKWLRIISLFLLGTNVADNQRVSIFIRC